MAIQAPTPFGANIAINPNVLQAIANPSMVDFTARQEELENSRTQRQRWLQDIALRPIQLEANIENQRLARQLESRRLDITEREGALDRIMRGRAIDAQYAGLNLRQQELDRKLQNEQRSRDLLQFIGTGMNEGLQAPRPDEGFVGAMPAQKLDTQQAIGLAMQAGDMGTVKALTSILKAGTPLVQIDTRRESERTKGEEKTRRTYIDDTIKSTSKVINTGSEIYAIEQQLKEIVSKPDAIETGAAADAISFVNSLALQAGVPETQLLSSGSNFENIEAFANKLTIPLAGELGINPTDFDFKSVKATIPSAGKSMKSNFALIDVQKQAIRRADKLQQLINQAEEEGKGLVEIRKIVNDFNKQQHIFVPKELPQIQNGKLDLAKLKIGEKYVRNDGVAIWNGQKFIEVEY